MKVAVYGVTKPSGRDNANRIGQALKQGFKKQGIPCEVRDTFNGDIIADVALAYGWLGELTTKIFTKYKEAGKRFVFFDLGYWARGQEGHYRLSVDDWDTAKLMTRNCPSDRFDALGVRLRDDWDRNSKKVMIVGMSDKAARTHGYFDGQWENQTRDHLKLQLPEHEIYVRAKPNKHKVKMPPIEDDLRDCCFVVSHHSNVAVDALVAGVPYWAKKGVGSLLSPSVSLDSDLITNPVFPAEEDKMQLLYDIAYAQWTPNEMRSGDCWNYIKGVIDAS